KPNSPCIDKGEIDVYSDIKYDIDKNLRLMGLMVDIGVYEMPKPKAIFPQDKSGTFSNKIIDYQWALNKYGNINASHNFMIKAWEKGNESIPVDKSSLNTYDFASLYSYQPRKAYQWIVGTVVDSFTYWSDTTTFYVGHNHPLYVKSGSNGDGTSWASAYGELIDALNASYPGDQVWVAAGTYKPATVTDRNASFKLKSAVALYGGFNGTESFEEYRNPKANLTILSGDIGISGDASDNSYHVFCDTVSLAEDSIVGALVDGFTITGGNSDAGNGAAMLNLYASPEVYNCIFTNNHAANGAAIYNSKASSPYIYNSLFYGNTAGTAGGAICSDATSKPVVISSTITNNTAATGGGISGGGTIGNTIIFGNSTGEIDGQPAVTYSCVKGGFSGAGNVKGNPGFIDVGRNNYRLSGFSSCYNKGSNALLPFGYLSDLDYVHSRILQGVVDIGAYELEKPDTIKIDSITPAQNSTYKNIYGPVVVYFNQSVQRMNLGKIQITPAVNLKSTSLNADSTQLTLNYKTPWSFDQDYKLAIAANSVAYAGNNLIGTRDTSFKFRIRSCIPALIILDKTATLFCPNVSTTLKVDTVKGDGNSDFKWYYGLNLLSKFNGLNKMNIDSISDNTLGLYKCEISDMCGLQTEDSIRLGYKANITYPEIVKKWNDILLVKNPDGLFSNYVWKYGGSDLGKNVQYITYNRFGTYDVWATDAGSGCTVHGQYVVNSKKSASIKIYPNPIHVSDIVTIDFGEQKSGTIRLFDMKGVLVYSGEFNTDVQYRFNNTNLMPGVYLLEIVSDGERTVNKLVINK
ncbi:MAG: T9SS type A sorting domain-containing protein, partial [Bacteroidota bacterium]|nr:T9SS type A sorting domain-containing protein [Bacteroidota bacterium]